MIANRFFAVGCCWQFAVRWFAGEYQTPTTRQRYTNSGSVEGVSSPLILALAYWMDFTILL